MSLSPTGGRKPSVIEGAYVLDASAVLAYLIGEPGGAMVGDLLDGAFISTVNLAEVVERLARLGVPAADILHDALEAGLQPVPLDVETAMLAATLRPLTRAVGLSLADRCCLALAIRRGGTAVTADRVWATVDVGAFVQLIGPAS